jgi:hypothetical protein
VCLRVCVSMCLHLCHHVCPIHAWALQPRGSPPGRVSLSLLLWLRLQLPSSAGYCSVPRSSRARARGAATRGHGAITTTTPAAAAAAGRGGGAWAKGGHGRGGRAAGASRRSRRCVYVYACVVCVDLLCDGRMTWDLAPCPCPKVARLRRELATTSQVHTYLRTYSSTSKVHTYLRTHGASANSPTYVRPTPHAHTHAHTHAYARCYRTRTAPWCTSSCWPTASRLTPPLQPQPQPQLQLQLQPPR